MDSPLDMMYVPRRTFPSPFVPKFVLVLHFWPNPLSFYFCFGLLLVENVKEAFQSAGETVSGAAGTVKDTVKGAINKAKCKVGVDCEEEEDDQDAEQPEVSTDAERKLIVQLVRELLNKKK